MTFYNTETMKFDLRDIKVGTGTASAALSAFAALFLHFPFFRTILDNVDSGANGVLIFTSMCIVLFVVNYFVCYLLLYFGRTVGKVIVSFFMIGNAVAYYFLDVFNALIDEVMIGNVLNTKMSEATSFYTPLVFVYVIALGVIPIVLLWLVKIERENWKRSLARIVASLGIAGAVAFVNRPNFLWVDRVVPVFGSQVLPWCYVVNTFRYVNKYNREHAEEIALPDMQETDSTRTAVVLVIGESARRSNFQLYGYDKPTNPKLSCVKGLKTYKAQSVAANTIDGVRAIVSYSPDPVLHEILPNYASRHGVDVNWRTSNWGEPPLHIGKVYNREQVAELYGGDTRYDGALYSGVKECIEQSEASKVLIVIHTYTSHGPAYYENYPAEYEKFTPVFKSVEVARGPHDALVNAYDNTILYTDALLAEMIEDMQDLSDRRCAVIYLSDHGESLGEHGRYMHGTGIGTWEEKVQEYEIPFIVWSNDENQTYKSAETVDQYHVFHSVLDYLGFTGGALDPSMSVFK